MLPIWTRRSRSGAPVGHADGRRGRLCLAWATLVLAVSLLAPPFAAEAQQAPKIERIGVLIAASAAASADNLEGFRKGLRELGHVEGKTFVLELRYGEGRAERLPDLARELVSLKVDVILASTDSAIAAAARQTQTIPIVMAYGSDPVGAGFVASLARPGGNVTGMSTISPELSGKRLELLGEAVPGLVRVALIWNPEIAGNRFEFNAAEAAARSLRLQLQSVEVSNAEDLDRALSAVTKGRAQALIVPAAIPLLFVHRGRIVNFTLRNRLPSMYPFREYVDAGGLISYGPNPAESYRRAATYVSKILKGAKPADLPVEQPTKFELVVNLKTAKALGLTFPRSILNMADEAIQ